MNRKIIRKRQSLWYDKRHPWNLVNDLAVYLRDSLRGYILWLENSSDAVNKDKKLYIFTPDDIEGKLPLLKKMYYSFDQVARDYTDSPWNIWWEKNCADVTYRIDKNGYLKSSAPSVPNDVREAQKKYNDDIDAGIKFYAKFFKDVSSEATCTYAAYLKSLNPKVRWRQLEKIDSNLIRIGAFGDDQAWYIYEGLVTFKNSKRMGHPGDVTEEDWEKYRQ